MYIIRNVRPSIVKSKANLGYHGELLVDDKVRVDLYALDAHLNLHLGSWTRHQGCSEDQLVSWQSDQDTAGCL